LTRVLHVLDKIDINSGVSSVVMNYYKKLDHSKLTFDFMLNEDIDIGTREYIEGNGSKVFIMPSLKVANTFKYIRALKMFYKSHDYSIIHGHVANSAVFYLGQARKTIPYRIMHSHQAGGVTILWKRIRNWVLTRFIKCVANEYIACSSLAADFMFGKNSNAVIIRNAIEINRFRLNEATREDVRTGLGLNDKTINGNRATPVFFYYFRDSIS